MVKDFYEEVYEKEVAPLIVELGGETITLKKFRVFDYLVRQDVLEYIYNNYDSEKVDGDEESQEFYKDMYYKIIKAIEYDYINPFNWEDYADVYYGYIAVN